MQNVFLLQNQDALYLSKSGEWQSSGDTKTLFRTQFKDEAINHKVEFSVKQPEIRIKIIQAELDANKLIIPMCSGDMNTSEENQATPILEDALPPMHGADLFTELRDKDAQNDNLTAVESVTTDNVTIERDSHDAEKLSLENSL